MGDRIACFGRLMRVEIIKLLARRFFSVSIAILLLVIPLWAMIQVAIHRETVVSEYRQVHALLVFVYGAEAGLKLASVLALLFAALSLAGEFDHGTIKTLLTRPVGRGEVYAAKAVVGLLYLGFLMTVALYVAALFSTWLGELGPVWQRDHYLITYTYEEMLGHAKRALSVALPAYAIVVFLGLFMSSVTETSSYAVALAFLGLLAMDVADNQLRPEQSAWWVTYFPDYAFRNLSGFSSGSAEVRWREGVEQLRLGAVTLPKVWVVLMAYAVPLAATGGWIFRARDIKA